MIDSGTCVRRALIGFLTGYAVCLLPIGEGVPVLAALAYLISIAALLLVLVALHELRLPNVTLTATLIGSVAGIIALRCWFAKDLLLDVAFDLGHVGLALAVGGLLANRVEHLWWMFPLGLTGSLADVVSVFHPGGLTHQLIEGDSPLLNYLLVVWPTFRLAPASPFMGTADLVFASMFYGIGRRFQQPPRSLYPSLFAGMGGAVRLAGTSGVPLPVTPFMLLAVTSVHARSLWRDFREYQRKQQAP